MKRYILKTHGCKSNQLESAVIEEKLSSNGFKKVKNLSEADIFILNSCSVTENADNEALRTLRHVKNTNPKILTILTGCSAQLRAKELSNLEFIDIVLGNNDKFDIATHVENRNSKITDIFCVQEFNNQVINHYNNTRGYLKIQDGCNNYCSYCTIPYARGKSRSNISENIIKQIQIYNEIGIKEIVLTGIHIGQWGLDFTPQKSLIDLLKEIEKTSIKRYRLGSLNPLEITDDLINFLHDSEKFCPHFHLSLQSLTDKTLLAMNRPYTADKCVELTEKLSQKFKLPFIGSDIITGFPAETDDDFETTINNVKKSNLSNIHVFPYSIRSNTVASEMKNQIDDKIKHERANILHKIAKEKFEIFKEKNIGHVTDLLIEKRPDKNTGMLKGVTANYLNVCLESSEKSLLNTIQKIKIVKQEKSNSRLIGKII